MSKSSKGAKSSQASTAVATTPSVASQDPVLTTLNDAGNADRFARKWGAVVRYVPEWKQWLVWTGAYWKVDSAHTIVQGAKVTAREIYLEAVGVTDAEVQKQITKHAHASQQKSRLAAMAGVASSMPALVVHAAELDKDPMLLGVQNGVIELASGTLRNATPDDYMTKQCPVAFDPAARCPGFLQFLDTILGGDQVLRAYVVRLFGYALTGRTTEQCLFFLHGSGANGKSTLLNVVKDLLGPDYCKQTPSESLMAKSHARAASNDLARLQGTRVVLSSEIEEGSRLSEARVKQLTGSDPVASRMLYQEFFEYVPQFKLIIAGNHQPVIRGDDTGIWRRIQLVPFSVLIPEKQRDHTLPDKLRAELPGILNLALGGCRDWLSKGLQPPKVVIEAVSDYRSDMDILGQWIDERGVVGSQHQTLASKAYADFKAWATANGFPTLNSNLFGRRLKERHARKRRNNGAHYQGIGLRYPPNP
jgi:putative DNA primase/helicase